MSDIFVEKQPEHALLSVVILGDEFPLKQEQHETLDYLSSQSDVMLIFGDTRIRKDKFASLYQVCAWTSEPMAPWTILDVLEYDKEIFSCHSGILVFWDLSRGKEIMDKALLLNGSNIGKPIFKRERLGPSALYEIYKPEPKFRRSDGDKRKYSTYTTPDPAIFLRPSAIKEMIRLVDPEFLDTFTISTPPEFLVSYISWIGLDFIDCSVEDLNYETKG